ncbi:Ssl1-like-domain-containing protein [Lipomyces tetrasporus]|uniref:General transcription and DNA repair factor IIH n=1 Tax=Lipomyces tetrasporus TaxID=54092 RepID=A0AAD7VR51_9ASCO|nr:Ssl1-like-domain-containing protein [Lipomyces tetrasporus]KAJ8098259.1 Ssl1-like-domain-containing protein [Lipomyces tetrasporus]
MSDTDDSYIQRASSPDSDYGGSGLSTAAGPSGAVSTRSSTRNNSTRPISNTELRSTTGAYIWEDSIQRSWDVVQEDSGGSLAGVVAELVQAGKRKRLHYDTTPLQRGIIRHLILIFDLSMSMAEKDLRPTRYQLSISYAIQFVTDYFEQNPISQLGVIGMRDGLANLVSQLGGSPTEHIAALQALRKQEPSGDPSLQNALEMARGALYHVPSHGTKEVVIIFGSLLSCDPGDIHKTIGTLKSEHVRVRIVGLAAEVAICKEICRQTNEGDAMSTYGVILNEQHFKELLLASCTPPAATKQKSTGSAGSELMRMGFPSRIVETLPSFCACHSRLIKGGYICPRCKVKVCSLPTECPACGLTLILSTHLARSYHHLMPLRNWDEVDWNDGKNASTCFACQAPFPAVPVSAPRIRLSVSGTATDASAPTAPSTTTGGASGRFRCPSCKQIFCIDCDLFAHEILHNCPGCETAAGRRTREIDRSDGH